MKLPLSKIVGQPITAGQVVVGFQFVEALKKLAADPISVKDRYALARTLKDVQDWITSYDASRDQLVKKYCVPAAEYRERLAARIAKAEQAEAKNPALPAWRKDLAALDSAPARLAGWFMDPEDPSAAKAFEAGHAKLLAEECEVFLDHKIKIPPDSKLSGTEMLLLIDVIEAPE